ncbi:hypothetical protein ABXK97_13480 [Yersinia enterocolitica]|uniref:hypothetical protein n=1 Tax=Yersinia enterocolitica TaxID=630 RepID=UPI00338E79EF
MTLVDNNMPEDMIKNVNGDTVLLINHMASQPDDKGLIADNLSHNHYQAMADMANLVPSM